MRILASIHLLCSLSAYSQTILWDHVDVPNTSFVIRRTTNIAAHWTNWPVVAIVDFTNAWKIPMRTNQHDLFTVQASNAFGMSDPPTCGVWRAWPKRPKTYTGAQVVQVVRALTARHPVRTPPLPQ